MSLLQTVLFFFESNAISFNLSFLLRPTHDAIPIIILMFAPEIIKSIHYSFLCFWNVSGCFTKYI